MARKKRALSPQADIEATQTALSELLNDEEPEEKPDLDVPDPLPALEPPEVHAGTVTDYLRGVVYQEIYGTDTPTERDRILQAFKDRI